jgi:hypothetical protein
MERACRSVMNRFIVVRRMTLEPVLLEPWRARNGSVWSPTDVKHDVKRLCSSRSASCTMRYELGKTPSDE